MNPLYWVVVGFVFCIGEMLTPGMFFQLIFGMAAFLTAILSYYHVEPSWQWLAFLFFSGILFLLLRKHIHFSPDKSSIRSNADSLIGKEVKVKQTIEPNSIKGRVEIYGEEWIAITRDKTSINTGETVIVKEISGTKLIVERGESWKQI